MSTLHQQFSLSTRIALVTGSSRGIGNALARGLVEAGATVIINGVDPQRVDSALTRLRADFPPAAIYGRAFDVTDEESISENISWIEANIGPLDVLINNVGVQHRVPLLDLDLADWERVIATSLTSAFLLGREVAKGMVQRGGGKIINIASIQAELARPTIAAYTAAKGGLRNLTRAMTAEWAGYGLQINALAPGYIQTDMTQKLIDDPEFNAWVLGRTPAARWGTVNDLVGPAVWLASDAANFVNGQTIFVDGGMSVVV